MNDWISAAGRDKQEEVPYDIILRANNSEYVALWVKLREKSLSNKFLEKKTTVLVMLFIAVFRQKKFEKKIKRNLRFMCGFA